MIFGGFQKLTLLDFPGVVACTLFTKGCNFLCPFCHNASLVNRVDRADSIPEDEVLSFLEKRQGILEGVCITGGEPLLHSDLGDFIKRVKRFGYKVKLDTNGSFPSRLKMLADEGLLDYVAMDIKNAFPKYSETAGVTVDLRAIEESIDFLLEGSIPYEFRTTVATELHTPSDIEQIARRIEGAEKYFLQNFADSRDIIGEGLSPVDIGILGDMHCAGAKYTKMCKIR